MWRLSIERTITSACLIKGRIVDLEYICMNTIGGSCDIQESIFMMTHFETGGERWPICLSGIPLWACGQRGPADWKLHCSDIKAYNTPQKEVSHFQLNLVGHWGALSIYHSEDCSHNNGRTTSSLLKPPSRVNHHLPSHFRRLD